MRSAESSCASLADPRFELSGEKINGDGQLPDLGVLVLTCSSSTSGAFR